MTTNNQTPAPTINNQTSAPTIYQQQDEISLVDIINVLLKRKKLILGMTAFIGCVGLFYAFSQKHVYQVETILLPPLYENIQQLNVTTNSNVTSNGVFKSFINTINSRKLRLEFFNKYILLNTPLEGINEPSSEKNKNNVFEGFSSSLKVKVTESGALISLEGRDKNKIGLWLDNLVEMSNKNTALQLARNLKATLTSAVLSLKIDISSKRSVYKKRREDEMESLKEAYGIAKKLKLTEHLFVPNVKTKSINTVSNKLDIINKRLRLSSATSLSRYMKGTKVLQAEINALKNRKNDDFKIFGLRDLQEQLIVLEAITIDEDKLQTVIVDKKAIIDVKPIRPNRKLITILSFILGGMLSLFVVFIMEFIDNFKKQVNNESNFDNA